MSFVYHIAPRGPWEEALYSGGLYIFPSPTTGGAIPCCDYGDLNNLEREEYYRGMADSGEMVLLHIDPDLLLGERTYESSPSGYSYYFIGTGLNPSAVVATEPYYFEGNWS